MGSDTLGGNVFILRQAEVGSSCNYIHDRSGIPATTEFHLHTCYEIYLFVSGQATYFIENAVYPLRPGDLFVINDQEVHKPLVLTPSDYDRIVVHFSPRLARAFSNAEFDLISCFVDRPKGRGNKRSLSRTQLDEILYLMNKIEQVHVAKTPESEILKLSHLLELLVHVNRLYMDVESVPDPMQLNRRVQDVIEYIDRNLEKELSLASLEREFHVDRSCLSRQFKKATGSSIHQLILHKRLSFAKQLLSQGLDVSEVCWRAGFGDYSNFVRLFTRKVGISPGKMKRDVIT